MQLSDHNDDDPWSEPERLRKRLGHCWKQRELDAIAHRHLDVPNPNHVGPGPLTATRAHEVVLATANEFPGLTAARNGSGEAIAAAEELLHRMIWHLQRAGFQAGRQRNPSGAISNDKLTVIADGRWRAYDVLGDLGAPGVPAHVQFLAVSPPDPVGDSGIPD